MKNNLVVEQKEASIHYKNYHRNWISELEVAFNSKIILSKKIDHSFLSSAKLLDKKTIDSLQYNTVYVNENKSIKNKLVLNLYACIPDTPYCSQYEMVINNHGHYTIEEIEEDFDKV